MHAYACFLSAGHGILLVWYCIIPEIISIINAPINIGILYIERIINCGNIEINELNAAPAPIETNRAGSAQQKIVPVLVNKAR
jgi:hypothetical protein